MCVGSCSVGVAHLYILLCLFGAHTHAHARKPTHPPAHPPTPNHTTHIWQSLENVKHEIEIMRKVNHPNCIKLYDIYETSKHVYMVMELVRSLSPLISARALVVCACSLTRCLCTSSFACAMRVSCVCLHLCTHVLMREHLLVPPPLLHFLCFATSLFAACACALPPHTFGNNRYRAASC